MIGDFAVFYVACSIIIISLELNWISNEFPTYLLSLFMESALLRLLVDLSSSRLNIIVSITIACVLDCKNLNRQF